MTFSDDLQWEKHTQATAAKASHTLGFLRRNLKDCSKQVCQQHTSPWSVQQWSMLLRPGIHKRQRMPTTLTKSSAALDVMLATTTRSGSKGASQQWLTHQAGKHFKTTGRCNVLPCSSRLNTTWSRSPRQKPSSGQTTAERKGLRGFSFLTPA